MTATPREPHQPPYQDDHEPRITLREHLEHQVEGLRRELGIELEARDLAVGKLERDTRQWKGEANEWRSTVSDITGRIKDEMIAYTDQKIDALREYVDERFKAGRGLVFALIGACIGFAALALSAIGLLLGTQ